MPRTLQFLLALLTASFFLAPATTTAAPIDGTRLSGVSARFVGGAVPSGRTLAIAADQANPDVLYVGGATSGVWKTVNGGMSWRPVFDDQDTSSIGSITVYQKDPDIVWVGTGEGKPRYGTGVGTGVFKSTDGGASWTKMGLEKSERVQRIVLHPNNPDIVYVAAVGPAYNDGEERGVFKSTDGGETWKRVLFTNPGAGAADLVMDPSNPNRLMAAMWEFRRKPWDFNSGGPGSGLFISEDAGQSWRLLEADNGLPEGELGRIGLAFDPANPARVYAAVEARKSGLYRSDDGGRNWTLHNDNHRTFGHFARPWYCQELAVDPNNPEFLYYSTYVSLSGDGGKSFKSLVREGALPGVAETHQALFLKNRPGHFLVATDQGVIYTRDGGKTWSRFNNLPFAQYYQISVDNASPYNIYGNLQDMADWRAPSAARLPGGIPLIPSAGWETFAGGEQGHIYPHPDDPNIIYTSHQQGAFIVQNLKTGEIHHRPPFSPPDGPHLRFNVHTGQATDPFDGDTVYLGSQFLHRSRDRGRNWEIISPDLTTNDPAKQTADRAPVGGLTQDTGGGERHTAIVAIAPSPARRGLIWVGSDDGKVHLTRDGGGAWTDLTANIPNVPEGAWVNHIEPSLSNPAEAYVVIDNHRQGDLTPYAFYTTDYGATWRSVVDRQQIRGNAYVLVADTENPNLLFLGTEFGLYASFDRAASWTQWRSGLPTASVRDLVVHPREGDLVIGTFGRGLFVIDDLSALRTIATDADFLAKPAAIAPVRPVAQDRRPFQGHITAWDVSFGFNKPAGALLTYVGDGAENTPAVVEILNGDEVIASMDGPNKAGLNRAVWDMRHATDIESYGGWQTKWNPIGGPLAVPGVYTARVTIGDQSSAAQVTIRPPAEAPVPRRARAAKLKAQLAVLKRLGVVDETRAALEKPLEALDALATGDGDLKSRAGTLARQLTVARDFLFYPGSQRSVYAPPSAEGLEAIAGGVYGGGTTRAALQRAYSEMAGSREAPNALEKTRLAEADIMARAVFARIDQLLQGPYAALQQEAGSSLPDIQLPEYNW